MTRPDGRVSVGRGMAHCPPGRPPGDGLLDDSAGALKALVAATLQPIVSTQPEPENTYEREPGYAHRYRDRRFATGSGPRTHRREVDAIRALLELTPATDQWLDVPSGAGRLSPLLPGSVAQVDRDPDMLRACAPGHPRACASAMALPFADQAFGGTLCMRLMQHLPAADQRIACLRELRRVSTDWLLVSFFDARSLQHWRRRARSFVGRKSRRVAITAARFEAELRTAGWELVTARPLLRFVSEQWIVLARAT